MIEILATSILKLGNTAGQVDRMLDPKFLALLPKSANRNLPPDGKEISLAYLQALQVLIQPLRIKSANIELGRLIALVKNDMCNASTLHEKHCSIYSRIEDHLEGAHFLYIDEHALAYYRTPEEVIGGEVFSAFPLLRDDASEAGKCLALGRYTACMFHLMRMMEGAVQRLGEKLGVTIIDKNNTELAWGKIVANISSEIEKMKGPERSKWSATCSMLSHVKQAWRNETMHPKKSYTESEAREVFEATRSFMRNLTERMSSP